MWRNNSGEVIRNLVPRFRFTGATFPNPYTVYENEIIPIIYDFEEFADTFTQQNKDTLYALPRAIPVHGKA